MRKFNEGRYDDALANFNKIITLEGNDFVRWKYFESLSKFKLLQHLKYRKLEPIQADQASEIEYTLQNLMNNYSSHLLEEDIRYWLAQVLLHFMNQSSDAYDILRDLRVNKPLGKWKEGTLYYMGYILIESNNTRDKLRGIKYWEELIRKYPDGLLKIIEDDTTYRVEAYVKPKLEALDKSNLPISELN